MYIVSVKSKSGQDLEKPFVTDNMEVVTSCILSSVDTDSFVIVDTISVR